MRLRDGALLVGSLLSMALLLTVAGPVAAADRTVVMDDLAFSPATVTISVGDRVTWINRDGPPHDAKGNSWQTPLLLTGDRASVRFTKAGTIRYTCSIHPEMHGTIVVQGAGIPNPPNTSTVTQDLTPLLLLSGIAGLALAFAPGRRRPS